MFSRCLNEAETHYLTMKLELLAIIYSVTMCRRYLLGVKFEIITVHLTLTFLNQAKFQNSQLIRWSVILQQYSLDIKHCSGRGNIIAEFFSRNRPEKFEDEEKNLFSIH